MASVPTDVRIRLKIIDAIIQSWKKHHQHRWVGEGDRLVLLNKLLKVAHVYPLHRTQLQRSILSEDSCLLFQGVEPKPTIVRTVHLDIITESEMLNEENFKVCLCCVNNKSHEISELTRSSSSTSTSVTTSVALTRSSAVQPLEVNCCHASRKIQERC